MEKSPEDNRRLIGGLGWAAIGAFVFAWDVSQEETLSHAFRRYQPYSGVAAAYTVAHLFGALPERADLFLAGFRILNRFNMAERLE